MTDCVRCGDCCDPVTLPLDQWLQVLDWNAEWPEERWDGDERGTRAEVFPNLTFMYEHWHCTDVRGSTVLLRCDAFDVSTRTCTMYEQRPPVCRDYPWYGKTPAREHAPRSDRCSFWLDLPDDVRPVQWRATRRDEAAQS